MRRTHLILILLFLAAAPLQAATRDKLDVVLLLDNSGSMHREGKTPGNDERFMRVAAVQYLIQKMAPGDRAALVTFDSVVHTDPAASRLRDVTDPAVRAAFDAGVRRIAGAPRDSTDMGAGLRAAAAILQQGGGPGRRQFLIFLTDGTPNPAHGANTPESIVRYAGQLGRRAITIHTVGLGDLSANPAEAASAQRLLEQIADAGRGAAHQAAKAEQLPALFGSIFAQLVGHEVSRFISPGAHASFTLAPGVRNLRVIGVSDTAPPQITLTGPHGKTYTASAVPPLLPGQETARLAVAAVNTPADGTWTVQANQGAVEVAYEPEFEAVLIHPYPGSRVPAKAPIRFTVQLRRRGSSTPLPIASGRVVVDYVLSPGAQPAHLTLARDPAVPGQFSGTLPDSGAVGHHNVLVRCFRAGESGEEEGGPAYAVVSAGRLPVLEVASPATGTSFAIPGPVPVRAILRLAGEPVRRPIRGLLLRAAMRSMAGPDHKAPTHEGAALSTAPDGSYTGRIPTGSRSGAAALLVSLTGQFGGSELEPQTVGVPLTLTPHPVVQFHWDKADAASVNPDDTRTFTAHVQSSAGVPEQVALTEDGLPHAAIDPASIPVPANAAETAIPVKIHWQGDSPGDYHLSLTAALVNHTADLEAPPLAVPVHVRTWLERNRWWFYPAVGLAFLLGLLLALAFMYWTREQARRRRKMRDMLNGAALYIPGTANAYRPAQQTVLTRRWYTFGGEGADVLIPDPAQPGQSLFKEPRLRISVEWDRKHRQPRLVVTPEGTDTILYDRENKLIGDPIVPTEGGEFLYVDPEHRLVRVNSEWTS